MLKKDAEIRKTLFLYRNNTFQLPLLLLNLKNLFQQRKDFEGEIKWHALEGTAALGSGLFKTWRCRTTFFEPSVSQAAMFFLRFSDRKRNKQKSQLLHRLHWLPHGATLCMMKDGWKLHLVVLWNKDMCSVSGRYQPTAWHNSFWHNVPVLGTCSDAQRATWAAPVAAIYW